MENIDEIVAKRLCRVDPGPGLETWEKGCRPVVTGGQLAVRNKYCLSCELSTEVIDLQLQIDVENIELN